MAAFRPSVAPRLALRSELAPRSALARKAITPARGCAAWDDLLRASQHSSDLAARMEDVLAQPDPFSPAPRIQPHTGLHRTAAAGIICLRPDDSVMSRGVAALVSIDEVHSYSALELALHRAFRSRAAPPSAWYSCRRSTKRNSATEAADCACSPPPAPVGVAAVWLAACFCAAVLWTAAAVLGLLRGAWGTVVFDEWHMAA
jgi:hypothetical protein